jgi:transcriptional regulator with XRE-family HTH domain
MEKEGKGRKITENKGKSPIVARIYWKAAEIGISKPELAVRVGIAKNAFANWSARNTIPPANTALALADELRCSVRWLITGKNDKEENYTLEEKNLITDFRHLDEQGKFEIKALIEAKKTVIDDKETSPGKTPDTEKKRNAG